MTQVIILTKLYQVPLPDKKKGNRGSVFFRIKGDDVVITKLDGTFITILKDGVKESTSVKNALKGNY